MTTPANLKIGALYQIIDSRARLPLRSVPQWYGENLINADDAFIFEESLFVVLEVKDDMALNEDWFVKVLTDTGIVGWIWLWQRNTTNPDILPLDLFKEAVRPA